MPTWYVGPNGEGAWADFNGDGIIDGDADFELLKPCYLAITRAADPRARPECGRFDLDGNGQVGATDFSIFSTLLTNGMDGYTGLQLQSADSTPRPSEYNLTLSVVGQGRINVTAATLREQPIAISETGRYPAGAQVILLAIPEPGHRFARWLDNGQEIVASPGRSVEVSADKELTAEFVPVVVTTPIAVPKAGWLVVLALVVLVAWKESKK